MLMTLFRLGVCAFTAGALLGAQGCSKHDDAAAKAQAARIADAQNAASTLKQPLDAIGTYRAVLAKRPHETVVDPRIGALAADQVGRAMPPAAPMPAAGADGGVGPITTRVYTALSAVAAACKADPTSKAGAVNDATRTACSAAIDQLDATLATISTEMGDAGGALPRVPAADPAASAKAPLGKLAFGGERLQAFRKAVDDKGSTPDSLEQLGNQAIGEMQGIGQEVAGAAGADTQLADVAKSQPIAIQVQALKVSALTSFYRAATKCHADGHHADACSHSCAELKAAPASDLPAAFSDVSTLCN
jgi:hypothetical protein